ncbi:hypothetical protein OROGR_003077 [Orobanche gracilis]
MAHVYGLKAHTRAHARAAAARPPRLGLGRGRVPRAGSLGALEPWTLDLGLGLDLNLNLDLGSWFLVLGNWSLGWSLGLFVGLVVAWPRAKDFLDKLDNVLGSYVHIRMTMYIRRMDKELNTVQT